MKFTDTLQLLISEKGITKNKMLTDLELGTGTFNTWLKRDSLPNGDTLVKIAKYFNVSVDYLLTGEPPEQKKEVLSIKDQHPELIFYDDSQEPQIPHLKPVGKPKDQNLTGTTPKYYTPPVSSPSAADDDMRKQNEIEMLELFHKLSTRDQIKEIARLELLQEK